MSPRYTFDCTSCSTAEAILFNLKVNDRDKEILCPTCNHKLVRRFCESSSFQFHMLGKHKSKYTSTTGEKVKV